MSDYSKIDSYLEANLDNSLEELSRLVAQPSVGAQNLGMKECAALVGEMLQARGFDVQIMDTPGAPVVYGERKGKSDKTMLIYNHYDVQPPEPLELWETPPFEPSLRDGKLYGRGVSDDKGHIVSRLSAIDALLETEGELPCNIKFVIEGKKRPPASTCLRLSRRIRTYSKPMPVCGNSAAWTIARCPCSTSACAASAM